MGWRVPLGIQRRPRTAHFRVENYGFRLDYHGQARELTLERAKRDWLDFAPVHALQYALRHLEDAFARFLSGLNRFPKPRKKFRDGSFTLPAEDVEFKRLSPGPEGPVSRAF
jgi:putative transposase